MAQPTPEDIAQICQRFLLRLKDPTIQPKPQFAIFIGGFPNSGKTTVARELIDSWALNAVHVQANDARVLLTEMGGFSWGENVRTIIRAVLEKLFADGHSVILDGAFIEDGEQSIRREFIKKYDLKTLLVAVTCSVETATERARKRYMDGKASSFGDWRANDIEELIGSMPERKERLERLLDHDRSVKVIDNDDSAPQESWEYVEEIWADFSKSLK